MQPSPAPDAAWVLVADEGVAHVLRLPAPGAMLEPLQTLTDAGAHAHDADFRRDAHGRRGGTAYPSNATLSAGQNKLHHEAEGFARRIAAWLADAHQAGRYTRLHVVAAPKFLGLLRQSLPPAVAETVAVEHDKDLTKLDVRALTARLFPPATGSAPSHR